MSFLSPAVLWLLTLLPVFIGAYVLLLRKRRRWASDHPGLVRGAGKFEPWKRHACAGLLLLAMATMMLAMARPFAAVALMAEQKTIVLAMDVSESMRAEDVHPSRLAAAQGAAKSFLETLPRDIRVGVVAYGGAANIVQPPTRNRKDIVAAIDGFELQPGTAVGNGLLVALSTIFPNAGIHFQQMSDFRMARDLTLRDLVDEDEMQQPVPPGSYASAAVVLLSDGQNTMGVDPLKAAQLAARLGVKVFTVGFGTERGETIRFIGGTFRVRLDEQTLKRIASVTRGMYFNATTAAQLEHTYESMTGQLGLERSETELTALFAAAAAATLVVAAGLSLWSHGRIL